MPVDNSQAKQTFVSAKTMTFETLTGSDFLDFLENEVLDLEQGQQSEEAPRFIRKLEDWQNQFSNEFNQDSKLKGKFARFILRANFVALNSRSNDELIQLFQNHFLAALKIPLNIKEYLRLFMAQYPVVFVENIRRFILLGLSKNEEEIGRQDLKINELTKPPQVKNWLIDYENFFTVDKVRREVEQITYLNQGQNSKILNSQEKDLLLEVIRIYDFLRFPEVGLTRLMQTPIQAPKRLVLTKSSEAISLPELETVGISPEIHLKTEVKALQSLPSQLPVSPPAVGIPPRISLAEIIPVHYLSQAVERAQVEAAAQKFSQASGQNFTKIIEELYQAVYPSGVQPLAKIKILAYLRLLAAAEKLDDLLEEERFAELLINYFKNRGQLDQITDFRLQPTAPKFLRYLLAYILEERLGLTENETARWGIHFANLMKQAGNNKYLQIAYYDIPTQQFKWK